MTDRELLEAAGKAIGLNYHHVDYSGLWWRHDHKAMANYCWNPISSLDDRYRLMQKLKISVDCQDCCAWHRLPNGEVFQEYWGADEDEADAILRVAAAIGGAK